MVGRWWGDVSLPREAFLPRKPGKVFPLFTRVYLNTLIIYGLARLPRLLLRGEHLAPRARGLVRAGRRGRGRIGPRDAPAHAPRAPNLPNGMRPARAFGGGAPLARRGRGLDGWRRRRLRGHSGGHRRLPHPAREVGGRGRCLRAGGGRGRVAPGARRSLGQRAASRGAGLGAMAAAPSGARATAGRRRRPRRPAAAGPVQPRGVGS